MFKCKLNLNATILDIDKQALSDEPYARIRLANGTRLYVKREELTDIYTVDSVAHATEQSNNLDDAIKRANMKERKKQTIKQRAMTVKFINSGTKHTSYTMPMVDLKDHIELQNKAIQRHKRLFGLG